MLSRWPRRHFCRKDTTVFPGEMDPAPGGRRSFPARPWVMSCLLALVPLAFCQAQSEPVVSWGNYFPGGPNRARDERYKAVCAGGYHVLALTVSGKLVAWGEDTRGQCDVPPGSDFISIAAGLYHSLALRSDGSIAVWGDKSRGQCSAPAGQRFRAIAAGSWHCLAIRSDGSLAAWGWDDQGQCRVPAGNDYRCVAAGYSHSLALRADGSLVAWGSNGDRECAVPSGHDFVAIAAGALHNVALRSSGTLVAWGRKGEGQCSVPDGNDFVSVAAGSAHGLALKRDGSVVAWGSNSYGECEVPLNSCFAVVAAGGGHSLGIPGRPVFPAVAPGVQTHANGSVETGAAINAKPTPSAGAAGAGAGETVAVGLGRAPTASTPTPGVAVSPTAGPSVRTDSSDALRGSQSLPPPPQPAEVPTAATPNKAPAGGETPLERITAPAAAPQPAPRTVAQPETGVGRISTPDQDKPVAPPEQRLRTPEAGPATSPAHTDPPDGPTVAPIRTPESKSAAPVPASNTASDGVRAAEANKPFAPVVASAAQPVAGPTKAPPRVDTPAEPAVASTRATEPNSPAPVPLVRTGSAEVLTREASKPAALPVAPAPQPMAELAKVPAYADLQAAHPVAPARTPGPDSPAPVPQTKSVSDQVRAPEAGKSAAAPTQAPATPPVADRARVSARTDLSAQRAVAAARAPEPKAQTAVPEFEAISPPVKVPGAGKSVPRQSSPQTPSTTRSDILSTDAGSLTKRAAAPARVSPSRPPVLAESRTTARPATAPEGKAVVKGVRPWRVCLSDSLSWLKRRSDYVALTVSIGCVLSLIVMFFRQ
jgi:hypothetical protein